MLKNGDNSFEKTISSRIYPDFDQDKEWLPKVICANCKHKALDENSEFEVLVNYKALAENVKGEQNTENTLNTDENCKCEICRLVSFPQNKSGVFDSSFFLKEKSVAEKQVQKPKITNFLNPGNDQNEEEKMKDYGKTSIDSVASSSMNNNGSVGSGERWILFQMNIELPGSDEPKVLAVHHGDVPMEIS